MAIVSDLIGKELDSVIVDLKQKHIELGMRASGKWVETINRQVDQFKGAIYAEKYTEQLVSGRKPGRFPPISAIEKWIVDKRITSDIPISSLAFLIARKIARSGTKYFQQGGTDLIDGVLTPQRIQQMVDNIGEGLTLEFSNIIQNEFKKAAV